MLVAVVVQTGDPVTPEVARVCPSTKPVIAAVSVGTADPKVIVWLLAVTVSAAGVTWTVPDRYVIE